MNRSKRSIKTPKRFDEEGFEAPRRESSTIKIKLNRASISRSPSTPGPNVPAVSTPRAAPSIETSDASPAPHPPSKPGPKPGPKPASASAVTPRSASVSSTKTPGTARTISQASLKTPSNVTSKSATSTTTKSATSTKPAQIQKSALTPGPKPGPRASLASAPKPTPIPLQRHNPIVASRRMRPRTPPVFEDVIPNLILPFWDARTAADEHEDDNVKELVHCQCGIGDELGLMVQCETCLTWQHAHCLDIDRPEDAPENYTCFACLNPRSVRESMRYAHDHEWLSKGRLKQFACDPNPIPPNRLATLRSINQLISETLKIVHLKHSLHVKSRILTDAPDDSPELKQFSVPWQVSPDMPTTLMNNDATVEECRNNLRLHIEQTEEIIGSQLASLEQRLETISKQDPSTTVGGPDIMRLKNDLNSIRKYLDEVYTNDRMS